MGYRSLRQCIEDLEKTSELVRIRHEVDPCLEAAEIHRRVCAAGGPALLFENVRNCQFPLISNLFGTRNRARYLFRDALRGVEQLIALKTSPNEILRAPWKLPQLLRTFVSMRPVMCSAGPVIECETTIDRLPRMKSWPEDGGPFATLPQVYTEHPDRPGYLQSNLGMYRIQLSGNQYAVDEQVGLHYQIHRSIAEHHAAAIRRGESLQVNVFVGGPPAMTLAAIMPLPEGVPELAFAGALGHRAIRMVRRKQGLPICAEADFCISGTIAEEQLPEGPFGDHLGYYSLQHDFPVLNVERVFHRRDAIWPFTVVGRPPQEDTIFGELIHELAGPAIPAVLPGVKAVHAVDECGVHPLLLAIGSERYVPWAQERCPQELLTLANSILGQGQLSLAKYLMIVAEEDDPDLDLHDVAGFLTHLLQRIDFTRDLHFQTRTTMDTLDYSGSGLNCGSKLVLAAAGPCRRSLATEIPSDLGLPNGFRRPRICLPGVLAITAPAWSAQPWGSDSAPETFCETMNAMGTPDSVHLLESLPLIVLVDDSDFCAGSLRNFLWVTFTRSDPAADVSGIRSFTDRKHWGCRGSLVIDARHKAHMAPPLISDPRTTARVDRLFAAGGPLDGLG